ncbi:hypothetical protein NMY3_00828 [Candidatus Nitrosocosmicus oleophilus]|jgi:hypothetical protein|uniref:Uncharacterized protein n=1 Tax=Candidatus Nitrosocosmicus oleophilus TaxID=1353260 RepID=A0A654LVM9_9ARCH|nr:hypothetical protein [Candidatus Nitrosocosmicus oleophilus]ALI35037.1 hypothetical protein NMY3_00828 [Candidatus Nitrosocosmicus oleophilus]
MKIITSKLTLLIILSTIIVVSSLTIPQNSMAATTATVATNVDENSVSLHPISAQDLDTTSGSNQYHTSFVWSNPGTSKMTDVLTASFTNILDTQIYTGLDKITN